MCDSFALNLTVSDYFVGQINQNTSSLVIGTSFSNCTVIEIDPASENVDYLAFGLQDAVNPAYRVVNYIKIEIS